MTNNEIIFEAVKAAFTPDQLAQLVSALYAPEHIATRRAGFVCITEDESAEAADEIFFAELAAETFHTFQEWKRLGYSVKKGQHAALVCSLWKYTDKPGKAAREAAAEAGEDAPQSDPHFYMAKSHLFNRLQVERIK